MPRTWSNVKYAETRSAAQKMKNRPSSLTLFVCLILFNLALFGGLIAYTMDTVIHHLDHRNPEPGSPAQR